MFQNVNIADIVLGTQRYCTKKFNLRSQCNWSSKDIKNILSKIKTGLRFTKKNGIALRE